MELSDNLSQIGKNISIHIAQKNRVELGRKEYGELWMKKYPHKKVEEVDEICERIKLYTDLSTLSTKMWITLWG